MCPNPALNGFRFHLTLNLTFNFITYDTLGRKIHENSQSRGGLNGLGSAKKKRDEFT